MMPDLSDLIARLKAEEGTSRELDAEIAIAAGYNVERFTGGLEFIVLTDGTRIGLPPFSESLDAAMTLVPEDHGASIQGIGDTWLAEILSAFEHHPGSGTSASIEAEAVSVTPALALCAAALEARQTMENEDEDD